MAYTFGKYGTFTGPSVNIEYRDNDDFSLDPFEGYFNLNDVSMVLVNTVESPADYVYMHLNGSNTSSVTLERSTGPIPTFNVEADQTNFSGDVKADGEVKSNGGGHVLSNKKNLPFDMPHPNKKGWRLRHVCIEGPEIAVYCRGKVPPNGVIELPSFWYGLVNPEDMTVNITPIGHWQELFVKEVRWGKQVIIQNNAGGNINAHYHIIARRLDDDLIVEYEGESHEDYPGGNEGYSFNFEHNYVKNLIQETVKNHLDAAP
jgi:hypothetical protein